MCGEYSRGLIGPYAHHPQLPATSKRQHEDRRRSAPCIGHRRSGRCCRNWLLHRDRPSGVTLPLPGSPRHAPAPSSTLDGARRSIPNGAVARREGTDEGARLGIYHGVLVVPPFFTPLMLFGATPRDRSIPAEWCRRACSVRPRSGPRRPRFSRWRAPGSRPSANVPHRPTP